MTEEERGKIQASYFCLRLYVETESYDTQSVLAKVETYDQWAYALHDKDVSDDGELKKAHYHVVIKNLTDDGKASPTSIQAVANYLGVSTRDIQAGRSENDNRGFNSCVKYLIHDTAEARNAGKYIYDKSIIHTNLVLDKIFKSFDMVKSIIDYIVNERPATFTALCVWCVENKCWDEFRRSQYVFKAMFDEVKRL